MLTTLLLGAYSLFMVLFLFGITIFVHELGHFLVARWSGFQVDTFSIGFGPALWKKTRNGILYKVGCLPFGGYVALPQLDPNLGLEDGDEPKRDLPGVAPRRKIPVLLAGVAGNLLLAFLIAVTLYYSGRNQVVDERACVVGYVAEDSAAWEAGLRIGDTILSVNDRTVTRWEQMLVDSALADVVTLQVRDVQGGVRGISLPTEALADGGRFIDGIGRANPCLVVAVTADGSAAEAGIRPNDRIELFDGARVFSTIQLIERVAERGGESVPITVLRDGERLTFQVTPMHNEQLDRAVIGVEFNPFDIHKRPLAQMRDWGAPVFRLLQAFVTPREAGPAAAAVGGPIKIFELFWWATRSSLLLALFFTGMINVNLAILNLLPIPVLDGGHIVVALIETVRRRPLNARMMSWVYQVFAVLLIALMLLISMRDVWSMVRPRPAPTEPAGALEQTDPTESEDMPGT